MDPARRGFERVFRKLRSGLPADVLAVLGAEGVSVASMRPVNRKERELL